MIKHIVMWKLKEFADGKKKQENAKIIKTDLENLQDKINEIKFIEVGINVNSSPQAYDIVLYSQFENMEDLNIYQNHSEHIRVGEFIKKVVNERVAVDYEV
ncbi:Dabb family protein [Clostridium sp. HMP27]|uniref:Dabb family protein n=1 Tax=Clostridium sp. HMP27 TaxID=1487921 RepID=UPI00052D702E|nr:Dabb family protein [Clostridium sp. HMP27]KGK87007.1 stress responsive protein [Clostridium sp. HMP27]